MSQDGPLFKILSSAAWAEAEGLGHLPWAPIDRNDGFVHLSALDQVKETAEKHFASAPNLVLIRLDASKLSDLRWEASRGGALFPHVYSDIPLAAVEVVSELVGPNPGEFNWPDELR